jgi:predicted aspartyl protease
MGQAPASTASGPDVAAAAPGVTEVSLVSEHGTLTVPVTLDNTVTEGFVVDSGASEVTISAGMARILVQKGQIRPGDYRGYMIARLADGSQVREQLFVIRSLKVGNRELTNVMGQIGGERTQLLLGQSFLRRFKSWSIDNRRRVLVLTN